MGIANLNSVRKRLAGQGGFRLLTVVIETRPAKVYWERKGR